LVDLFEYKSNDCEALGEGREVADLVVTIERGSVICKVQEEAK
jgi:hypothetical protein